MTNKTCSKCGRLANHYKRGLWLCVLHFGEPLKPLKPREASRA